MTPQEELAAWGCKPVAPPSWEVIASNLDRGEPEGKGWVLMDWRLSEALGSVFLWARPPQGES